MEKGWYTNSTLKLQIEQAKIWATQMGYLGEEHRDQVSALVKASLLSSDGQAVGELKV
jgi:hypothetical protein